MDMRLWFSQKVCRTWNAMAFSQAVRRQPDSAHSLRNQASLLNLDVLALIGPAASAATACASAQSSLVCAEAISNCLRMCAVESAMSSEGDFTPNSSLA